ncbi:MAG: alpha-glucosidase C-terminal domain-containing protein [Planctomycetes bacterium]|nr:alpha-glucosidase C-terminal domain-containing protein [Planctomycetota bacterium]
MQKAALLLLAGAFISSLAIGQATTNPAAASKKTELADRSDQRMDNWWNDSVFYQVFVRSFKDSEKGPLANDGIGDFAGLIEKLDYLNDGDPNTTSDLGVTALWLMPVFEGPTYHGYETSDYYKIESEHGTNEDFKRFMAECKKRGIRVILDLVLNHTSSQHPWFKNAADPKDPHHDWFIWSKDKPAWKGPWNQEVWFNAADAGGRRSTVGGGGPYFYGIFSSHMPDLNYHNPEVTKEMNKVTEFWIKDYGVDGYRLDAIRHLVENGAQQENVPETHEWLRNWHKFYKSIDKNAFTVGEVWTDTATIASYVPDQLDTCFEFDMSFATIDAVNAGDAKRIKDATVNAWKAYPRNQFCTFLSNHDQTRVMTRFGDDFSKAKLAASLLFTQPGIPFMYYGEELGVVGDKPDENLRTPMQWNADATKAGFTSGKPWRAANKDTATKNVQAASSDPNSLLNLYKTLVRLRQANPALAKGEYTPLEASDKSVYAFARTEGNQTIIVVANLSDKPVQGCRIRAASGSFGKVGVPRELLQTGTAINPAAPRVVGKGGIADYVPVNQLAPRSVYVLDVSGK